ncbi:MAG TPA: hypothetical protein DCE42_15430 [Myxococcales bacterium]|nr:hypothetical protein [Myxococcales bacterium]|tara:strand:+ start:6024 stop:6584 length:561 start_codon:yes stop_codon:yes gene_type:complete
MKSTRAHLHDETAPIHKQLDQLISTSSPFADEEKYALYLTRMEQLYVLFSTPLDEIAQRISLPVMSSHIKKSIEQDKATLPKIALSQTLPIQCWSLDESWGITYTLEGSTMGARYLLRTAREQLPHRSHTFLEQVAQTGKERWPRFCEALESSGCTREQATRGAQAVFHTALTLFESTHDTTEDVI